MSDSGEVESQAPMTEIPAKEAPPEEIPVEEAPPVTEEKNEREKKEKKKARNAKAPSHPPYFQMIKEAITSLNEKGGSSPYAIAKYMVEKHKPVLPSNFKKILGLQLKNSVARGKLIKIKASYKLSETTAKSTTKAVRANAGTPKEGTDSKAKKRRTKMKAMSKIENANSATRAKAGGRRARKAGPAKPKQLKSIKSPVGRKAKRGGAA